jgi:hypothetical protein
MNTAKDIFDDMMGRIKNMDVFEIKREVPDNWIPRGTVPFDISVKNNVASFKVYAYNYIDAEDQVSQYLEKDDE